MPTPLRPLAYHNRPLLVGQGQNIAQPYLIALMTSLARVHRGDVVYETGTGAGYHAAVLAEIADRVYSVEVIDRLAIRAARIILEDLGYRNVETRIGDGYFGWPEKGRSDVRPACPHLQLVHRRLRHARPEIGKRTVGRARAASDRCTSGRGQGGDRTYGE